VECTIASINEVRKQIKLLPLPVPQEEHASSIAAIANMATSSQQMHTNTHLPMLPTAAMLRMSAYPVVAVCPPNESSILSGGDSNLSCNSNSLVSKHIPFFLPHLIWNCAIESHDPSSISCIPVEALIDHGSGPVLIDQNLVTCLQLLIHMSAAPTISCF